jgi:hypothetical protein
MAAPPFRTALDQLKCVHQINVISIQWVRRVGHLATSLGISNQFVVVHVSNVPAIIVHIDSRLSHLFRFLGEFKIEIQRSAHRTRSDYVEVRCSALMVPNSSPSRIGIVTRQSPKSGNGNVSGKPGGVMMRDGRSRICYALLVPLASCHAVALYGSLRTPTEPNPLSSIATLGANMADAQQFPRASPQDTSERSPSWR